MLTPPLVGTKLQNISPSLAKGGMTFKTGQTGGQKKVGMQTYTFRCNFHFSEKFLISFDKVAICNSDRFEHRTTHSLSHRDFIA